MKTPSDAQKAVLVMKWWSDPVTRIPVSAFPTKMQAAVIALYTAAEQHTTIEEVAGVQYDLLDESNPIKGVRTRQEHIDLEVQRASADKEAYQEALDRLKREYETPGPDREVTNLGT
jgi:hypothetical protein